MRLKEREIQAIKNVVHSIDPSADVYLYGSRVDDEKKGGDIDLFIQSDIIDQSHKTKIRLKLHEQIGDQKIDITIAQHPTKAIHKIALEEGIQL